MKGLIVLSDKQLILNTVKNISDTSSYEEILYTLYTQLEIRRGIKDMEKGKVKTTKEALLFCININHI